MRLLPTNEMNEIVKTLYSSCRIGHFPLPCRKRSWSWLSSWNEYPFPSKKASRNQVQRWAIGDEVQGSEFKVHFTSPLLLHVQINVLLQAYISQLKLDGFALVSDMVYVTQVGFHDDCLIPKLTSL